jgi:hypothetical protein
MAKRLGKYIKGAQGDLQMDTDVTNMSRQSTAHQQVSSVPQKSTRRKRK